MMTGTSSQRWLPAFVATLIAMFCLQTSNLGFSPLLPSIQRAFGLSYTQLGLFTGIYGLLAIALSVPAGLAAKRFGEKPTLVTGLITVGAGTLLLSRASDFGEALIARAVTIAGYRCAFVCTLVAVALSAPLSMRGRTMGVLGATSALAAIIGAPLGGALERSFGWRAALFGYAAAAILGAVVFASFYRPGSPSASQEGSAHAVAEPDRTASAGRSAFRTPLVWMLALVVGMGGFGQFTVTFFVPSVARTVFGLDAVGAGLIISTGYICAVAMNLVLGVLADRYNQWVVLGAVFALLATASVLMTVQHLVVFRIATAAVLSLGFAATNQLYAMAGTVMKGRETSNAIGVVSLGAGLFGYFGPQMLGILRDWTGGFVAGFYMVAVADVITLMLIALLYQSVGRQPAVPDAATTSR